MIHCHLVLNFNNIMIHHGFYISQWTSLVKTSVVVFTGVIWTTVPRMFMKGTSLCVLNSCNLSWLVPGRHMMSLQCQPSELKLCCRPVCYAIISSSYPINHRSSRDNQQFPASILSIDAVLIVPSGSTPGTMWRDWYR